MSSTSTEWNHEVIEKLIDLYRQKPELWDPKNNNYHIKNKKHDAWINISSDMGCDVNAVKTKITSLLSSFRREKSKMKKSMGTGKGRKDIYISNWFAFKFFDFLTEKDTPKDNVNTQYISDEEDSQGDSSQSAVNDANDANDANDQSEIQNEEQSSQDRIESDPQRNETNNSTKRKIFVSPKNRNQRKKEKEDPRLSRAYEIIDSASNAPPRDECFVYGEHVANKLRKFNEKRRSILMHKMNNLIFEAEMEVYNLQQGFGHQNNYNNYENIYSSSSTSSLICTPESSPIPPQPSTVQEQLSTCNNTHESSSQYGILQNFVTNFAV